MKTQCQILYIVASSIILAILALTLFKIFVLPYIKVHYNEAKQTIKKYEETNLQEDVNLKILQDPKTNEKNLKIEINDSKVEQNEENQVNRLQYWKEKQDIHYKPSQEKAQSSFNSFLRSSSLSANTLRYLAQIKTEIDSEIANYNNISSTIIQGITIKNRDELKGFYISLRDEGGKIDNCISYAKQTQWKLGELHRCNIKVIAKPDHAFNLFRMNSQIYFYDSWGGGIIAPFTPEYFYKYGDLGGIYEVNYHKESSEQNYLIESKLATRSDSFNVLHEFQEKMNLVNKASGNEEIQQIIHERIKKEIEIIDKDDLLYDFKVGNLTEVADHFKIILDGRAILDKQRELCREELYKIEEELMNEKTNDENKHNKTLEIFFRQTMKLPRKKIIKDSGNHCELPRHK